MIKFKINGECVPKERPRHRTIRTVDGRVISVEYTPQKTKEFEEKVRFEFMASTSEQMPVYDKDVPLEAEIIIHTAIPKSYTKKKREQCLAGKVGVTKKPDLDNLAKAILDSIQNGYAMYDDAQVTKLYIEKLWTEDEPYAEVTIKGVDE